MSAGCVLLGLAIFRPSINGFVASAIIECGGADAKEGIEAHLEQFAGGRIEVRPVESAQGHYSLMLSERGREETLALLDEAACHVVAAARAVRMIPDRQAIELAARGLAEAEESEREARAAYELWRQSREQDTKAAHSRAKPGLGAPRPAPEPQSIGPKVNPHWAELVEQLERLRTERTQLLLSRTDAHPTVIDLDMRIGDIEKSLHSTEKYLPDESPELQPVETPTRANDPDPDATIDLPSAPQPDAEGERLKAAWQQALVELAQTREAHRKALQLRAPAPSVEARIVSPAEVVGVKGGDLRLGWVVALALASLVVGLILARAGSMSSQSLLFATIDEITQTLKVPVIASLATADGPPIPKRSPYRVRGARYASRAAAGMAIVFVSMFAYAAAIDPLVLHIASTNPVQAYAFAIDLFWPL